MPLIVVVGAGIAGLATALALADAGEVVVLERRSATEGNFGAGIQISPNGVKALRALGVEERVNAAATVPAGLVVRSGKRVVTRVAFDEMPKRFGATYFTASRAGLHDALSDAVEARGIAVRYDAEVTFCDEHVDGVHVPGVHGQADLVVAADGVSSPLREKLVGDAPRDTGWTAWRGRGSHAEGGDTDLVLGAGHHLVRYRLTNEQANCVLVARDPRGPDEIARTETGQFMTDVEDWQPWTVRVRQPAVFHAGKRVAFVGDAAHAIVPFLAQGATLALEDAAVLGMAVARHGLGDRAVAVYAEARRRRVARIAALCEEQGRIYHLPFPLAQARDFALGRVGSAGIYRRMGFIWGWSPEI